MEPITYAVSESIATVRFNRPEKKNAITLEMYAALAQALEYAGSDDDVRVVILTGTGDTFTAGNDITNFRDRIGREDGGAAEQFMTAIVNAPKPLVAAVNGAAIGVGATMLMHCDLVYASTNASLKLPFVDLGICCEFASSLTLPAATGLQRASELLLLGDTIDARQAMALGLVNEIHEPGQLQGAVRDVAARIAKRSPEAVRTTREFLRAGLREQYLMRLRAERNEITRLLHLPHARQAMTGFFAERPARGGGE